MVKALTVLRLSMTQLITLTNSQLKARPPLLPSSSNRVDFGDRGGTADKRATQLSGNLSRRRVHKRRNIEQFSPSRATTKETGKAVFNPSSRGRCYVPLENRHSRIKFLMDWGLHHLAAAQDCHQEEATPPSASDSSPSHPAWPITITVRPNLDIQRRTPGNSPPRMCN